MKIFLTILGFCVTVLSASGQALVDSTELAKNAAYFKKLEEGFLYNIQWAYELNLLEQVSGFANVKLDRAKVAEKGNIYSHAIHDSSGYKVLFWYQKTLPKICAVADVTFDEVNMDAIITYMDREATSQEASICKRILTTLSAISRDSSYTLLPATCLQFIPLPLAEGGQVIVYQRSLDLNTCIFGNDYIFTFDAADSLIGTTKVHDMPTKSCVDYAAGHVADSITLHHWHDFKSLKDFPITDMASVFFYAGMHHIKKFLLIGNEFIFKIDLGTTEIWYLVGDEFKKALLQLPQRPTGWTL
ncbi:hypothetical protein [Chitinophaga filiformis]|uniref:Uncharacterized protein n=1 Tax=Chitinophaga filiformis TaxID=104663 RepID=A0A1G7MIJ8_CHIFI|nr:hypothetical protein [Chitinophaga filiformis]SDF61436.1 hypothetical protein SAMN04488121_102443 [Chitinophaga filiformis]